MISLVSTLKNKCPLVFSTIILGLLTTASFAQVSTEQLAGLKAAGDYFGAKGYCKP